MGNLQRTGRRYSPAEILPHITKHKSTKIFDGHEIKMWSLRYHTFAMSLTCEDCGLKGEYFVLEKHVDTARYHFNLYAELDTGEEVLFTKDHIIPVADGGVDRLWNLQTMCYPCNIKKGSWKNYFQNSEVSHVNNPPGSGKEGRRRRKRRRRKKERGSIDV